MYAAAENFYTPWDGWLGVIAQDGFFKTWEDGAPEGWSCLGEFEGWWCCRWARLSQ